MPASCGSRADAGVRGGAGKRRRSRQSFARQHWIAKVFRDEAAAGPHVVYSTEMAAELAAAIPGAVAFVTADSVPKGLKVLKINGRLPGDEDYPLR